MLTGMYEYTVDEKGRVVIPRHFRVQLGVPFVLTGRSGGCLVAMSRERWESLAAGWPESAYGPERLLVTAAVERTPARPTGRVVLPRTLRHAAQIQPGRKVLLAGAGDRIEIWARERFDQIHPGFGGDGPFQVTPGSAPGPMTASPPELRTRDLFGIPVIEVRGVLTGQAADALRLHVKRLAPLAATAVVIDLRQALGLDRSPPVLGTALSGLPNGDAAVCLITQDPAAGSALPSGARIFRTLEDALWWLDEQVRTLGSRARPEMTRRTRQPGSLYQGQRTRPT